MIKKTVIYLCSIMFVLTGCISGESSPSCDSVSPLPVISKNSLIDENSKIFNEDITIIPIKDKLNIAYTNLAVKITNNSPYPFTRYSTYRIYEEIEGKYFLVDNDGDGLTETKEKPTEQIKPGETVTRSIYLGKITDDDFYSRPGRYKVEIPINENCVIPMEFEIVDDYIPLDTGISLLADKEQYSVKDDQPFTYTIINNSNEPLAVTLDIYIARYENGKWHRLPDSERYGEIYYHANMWSEKCPSGGTKKQEFSLSLPEMVGEKLSPGKYRLEKELFRDWYFAEFEVV